jgi:cell division septation protein DedD
MDEFKFDMGDPKENVIVVDMTPEQVQKILQTVPKEALENYGIGLDSIGNDTPREAVVEGRVFAAKILGDGGATTRMVREGYTITDHADFYWFGHQKWSGRGGKRPGFIIPHHMAGNLSVDQFYAIMASSRQMSPTVSVHTDGTVYAWVPEEMRPWTTGSYTADQDALTLEIANDEIGGDWHVSDTAYDTAVAICAEWCKRYGIDPHWAPGAMGTLQMHKEWAPTACPGPYLSRKIESGQMEADIKAAMNPKPPTPTPKPTVKYRVQAGAFKSEEKCDAMINSIHQKGLQAIKKYEKGLWKVQCGLFNDKDNALKLVDTLANKGFVAAVVEVKA